MRSNPSTFKGDDMPVERVSWKMYRNSSKGSMGKKGQINIVFLQKLNGNMQQVQELTQNISSEITDQNLVIMHGTPEIQTANHIQLVRKSPIHGGFSIFTVMSGNGYRISGTIIMIPLCGWQCMDNRE